MILLFVVGVKGDGVFAGPEATFGFLRLLLGGGEAAFHGATVAIIESGMSEAGADEFFVQQCVAIPDECEKTVVAVFSFEAEREADAVVSALQEVFRELASFGAPGFDRRIGLHAFWTVDALEAHASAVGEKNRVAIDIAEDFMNAFVELVRGWLRRRERVRAPEDEEEHYEPDGGPAMVVPVAAGVGIVGHAA